MRTLIDIQDDLMTELMKTAQVKTKKEAVTIAIKNFLKQKKKERLAELLGCYEFWLRPKGAGRDAERWIR